MQELCKRKPAVKYYLHSRDEIAEVKYTTLQLRIHIKNDQFTTKLCELLLFIEKYVKNRGEISVLSPV